MQVGDVYRDDPAKFSQNQRDQSILDYGTGPFLVTCCTHEYGGSVYVKSLEDGRSHGPWTHPKNWGVLDVFLTAAHKANEHKDAS